jgi:hypothetical protein
MTDKPMSADEKIGALFDKYEVFLSADMFEEIHHEIKKAERLAYKKGFHDGFEEGFKDAIERAAKEADSFTYEVLGILVTCKDGIEYVPGLYGAPQAIGFCSGKGHVVPTDNMKPEDK